MRIHPLLVALLIPAVVPARADAQGTLRGILHDSLRVNGPVAGAEVVLLGASRRATTDSAGRFVFTDVAPGRATVAFTAPWLDSLALPPLQAVVEVASGVDASVALATPSRRSFQVAVCGAALAESEGIILGEVRDPEGMPRAAVWVGARWTEMAFAGGTMERRTVASLDTANASGFYALCGIPNDTEVSLVAATDDVRSGDLVVGLGGEPVRRRDLVVAPATLLSRVRGTVLGVDGQPLEGATVAVADDTARTTRTDAEGRFLLDQVPRRSGQLLVRALGYAPRLEALEPWADEVELEPFRVEKLPPELAALTITADRLTRDREGFEARRRTGLGSFITDSLLARMPQVNSSVVASYLPRVALQSTRRGPMLMMRRGFGFCRPRFYLDGVWMGSITAEEEQDVLRRAKRIESYTANEMPAEYNDFDGCGSVVIWTR